MKYIIFFHIGINLYVYKQTNILMKVLKASVSLYWKIENGTL